MSDPVAVLAELAALIEEASGNVIPPSHLTFLAETAKRRAASLRLAGVSAYVGALARGELPGEWSSLLPHVTVKESYLFRHPQHFAALANTMLPRLAAARAERRSLRDLVGRLRPRRGARHAGDRARRVPRSWPGGSGGFSRPTWTRRRSPAAAAGAFGERAVVRRPRRAARAASCSAGRAPTSSRPRCPPHRVPRPQPRARALRAPVPPVSTSSSCATSSSTSGPRCSAGSRREVARTLAPDGFLFLGPAETLWQVAKELDAIDLGDCFCYRHAGEAAGLPSPAAAAARRGPLVPPGRDPEIPPAQPPIEPRLAGAAGGAATPHGGADTAHASERPRPAATGLRTTVHAARPVASEGRGTRERLALAARQVAMDRLAEAAELLDLALLADPSDAGVHALEGFMHDISGRSQMALASYRAALFLDAGLFQVRLLLADSLRRLGFEQRAVLEYREVLAALAAGRAHDVEALAPLGLPGRGEALRRCREALRAGGSQDWAVRPL